MGKTVDSLQTNFSLGYNKPKPSSAVNAGVEVFTPKDSKPLVDEVIISNPINNNEKDVVKDDKKQAKIIASTVGAIGLTVVSAILLKKIPKSSLKACANQVPDLPVSAETQAQLSRLKDFNMKMTTVDEYLETLPKGFKRKKYRIATSGYSSAPENYAEPTRKFLKHLDKNLGRRNVGYVAPSQLEPDNVYSITADVAGLDKDRIQFVTAERFLKYLKPELLDKNLDMKKYSKLQQNVFTSLDDYVEATAKSSNVLVATGGRKIATQEIVEALKNRNKVVLVLNKELTNGVYNYSANRIENTAEFIEDLFSPTWCKKAGYPIPKDVDIDWMREHPDRINQLLRYYVIDGDDEALEFAAERAANFIKSKTLYDYFPEDLVVKLLQPS